MLLRKLIAVAGTTLLLAACGAGPTDPMRTMGDDDGMMLRHPVTTTTTR